MENEGSYVSLGLKVWKTQIERADKLFGSLSSEDVLREIAPGKNRLLYLWGHLTAIHDAMLPHRVVYGCQMSPQVKQSVFAIHDAMLPLLALGERLHPEFDVVLPAPAAAASRRV